MLITNDFPDPTPDLLLLSYLERAVAAIREKGQIVSDEALAHLSPLKWEHINLTGDYHWRKDAGLRNGELRPLRSSSPLPVTP